MDKFYGYPGCSTCNKAKRWLKTHEVEVDIIDISTHPWTVQEIAHIYKLSGLPLKKLFNTSGVLYKTLNLKDLLINMNEAEQMQLLSQHGMLIKRPILLMDNKAYIGFNETLYSTIKAL